MNGSTRISRNSSCGTQRNGCVRGPPSEFATQREHGMQTSSDQDACGWAAQDRTRGFEARASLAQPPCTGDTHQAHTHTCTCQHSRSWQSRVPQSHAQHQHSHQFGLESATPPLLARTTCRHTSFVAPSRERNQQACPTHAHTLIFTHTHNHTPSFRFDACIFFTLAPVSWLWLLFLPFFFFFFWL